MRLFGRAFGVGIKLACIAIRSQRGGQRVFGQVAVALRLGHALITRARQVALLLQATAACPPESAP